MKFIIFILSFLMAGISAAQANSPSSKSYENLDFKEMYYELIKGRDEAGRAAEYAAISLARSKDFLTDAKAISSAKISLAQLKKLNAEFRSSEAIGEGADMALPLMERNTICYLRALWVHMKLLQVGVPDSSIRKIVLEGYINHRTVSYPWNYHIATTVKAGDQNWYVIDLENENVMKIEDWVADIQAVQQIDSSALSPYLFLLSVRPSKQYTLVDHAYDMSIDFGPSIGEFIKFLLSHDTAFAKRLKAYLAQMK